jgi:hypothetical protein
MLLSVLSPASPVERQAGNILKQTFLLENHLR